LAEGEFVGAGFGGGGRGISAPRFGTHEAEGGEVAAATEVSVGADGTDGGGFGGVGEGGDGES
jgi:hypothetical protein